jgi:ubiquitin-activating enzyme E1-like protein 2
MAQGEPVVIDDSLYSRQRYVLGDNAMQRMSRSNVLLSGLGGLGVEIAKNVALAGVKSLTLHDTRVATYSDLSGQFFLREDDVTAKTNRAVASCPRVAELNPYVTVRVLSDEFTPTSDLSFLSNYQCVILTESSLELQLKVDQFCRDQKPPIKFISSDVFGVFSSVFCDLGESFDVVDEDGEDYEEIYVDKIIKGNPGVVSIQEGGRHGLQDGDCVTFKEVGGMTAINGTVNSVKVRSPTEFSIGDISSEVFQEHTHGGIVQKVKVSKTIHFESLEVQLKKPDFLLADFAKPEVSPTHFSKPEVIPTHLSQAVSIVSFALI